MMMRRSSKALPLFLLTATLLIQACTPKTTEQAKTEQPEPPAKPVVADDPCATFADSRRGEQALDAHVIYRDYIRAENYVEAIPYWRKAYTYAPAADGQRETHFNDGLKIYDYYLNQAETIEAKRTYLDSIYEIYAHMGECYHADDPGYIDGRIAFDLYYKYRDLVMDDTIFERFASALNNYGLESPAFIINPFTALLVEMYKDEEIPQDTATKYAKLIVDICEKHLEDPEEGWPIVVSYAPTRLESFETVRGFFDCEYYLDKYYTNKELDSLDCEELVLIASRLMWGGCEKTSPEVAGVYEKYADRCAVATSNTTLANARTALEEGRFKEAVDYYEQYLESTDDPEKKAKYNLRIAKIYYAHIQNFPKSRQYAYEALKYQPGWGEPYMVIGKLYASSGPLCGPGRGWDSQIVTWPAIDMFKKARQVDPSVAPEANKLINRYERYMPSVEDIFQRQLNEGDSFTVPCWIQEKTTIRAARS